MRIDSGATLNLDGVSLVPSSAISIDVAGTLHLSGTIGTDAVAQITTTGSEIDYADASSDAAPIDVTDDTTQLHVSTGTATQSGIISESGGPHPIEKTGGGTLVLSGANTYSGGTKITAGTIQLGGVAGSIGTGGLDTTSAGTFDLNSHDQTVTTLAGTGGEVTNSAATTTSTLTVKDTSSYGGTIEDGDGVVAVEMDGTGKTLTLSGTNTYTGGTTITAGTVQLGANGAIGGGGLDTVRSEPSTSTATTRR